MDDFTEDPINPHDQILREEFLSEEDLDLQSLSFEELVAYMNMWLKAAQASNDLDENEYSHGVFMSFGD